MTIEKRPSVTSYGGSTTVGDVEHKAVEGPGGEPWTRTGDQVVASQQSDGDNGLTDKDAEARLNQYGKNMLDEAEGVSIAAVLIRQVCNAMIMVLFISMAISFGIRDWIAGGVIAGVIVINVVVGFIQEFSAEKTMEALRGLSSPTAKVIRGGKDETIPAVNLVPGDLVTLKVGDTVPADCRILSSMNFETDEALLTGESLPVAKDETEIFETDTPVGDRINMCFASSTITKGRATAIVVGTGMQTEIGKIAQSLKGENGKVRKVRRDEDGNARKRDYARAIAGTVKDMIGSFLGVSTGTPLHRLLAKFSIFLFGVAVVLAIVAMAAQKFNVTREVAVYAIVLAIAMIPASLVVVLTITMAMGTKAMVRRNVIVRKLDSLEALGAVNDICSDKTGTLTQGKMVVRKGWIPTYGTYEVTGAKDPFNPTIGTVHLRAANGSKVPVAGAPDNELAQKWLLTASLANIANVRRDHNPETGAEEWRANGDPTEIAIQVFTCRLDFGRHGLAEAPDAQYKHLAEYPFDSSIKRMSSVYQNGDSTLVFTKGAVERILGICTHWYGSAEGQPSKQTLEKNHCDEIFQVVDSLTKEGLRVLAFAQREDNETTDWSDVKREDVEKNLTFLGLVGIYDPPREESAGAVRQCHLAGINVHMLTGDHPGTARAIAQEVGILPKNLEKYAPDVVKAMVVVAPEFDAMTDEQIDAMPLLPLVIARCAPQTKVRMIEALHRRKAFTAMTGDGVNDSPSLKRADVGIAMGIAGSDVAKDVSDIVLSDDNFASIMSAVEEGRRMSDNIQKFALHLLAGNIAQAAFLVGGLGFKDASGFSVFPLSPVEVLWVIMITSSFPAMGLGQEQAEPDIMRKPPRDPRKSIFTWEVIIDMLVYGVWLAIINIVIFVGIVYGKGNGHLGELCNESYSESCNWVFRARSCGFVVITWALLFLAWEIVDMRRSVFHMTPGTGEPVKQFFRDLWRNKLLFWSIIGGFVSVFPIIYIPVINKDVFKHSPISWEWGVAFAGTIVFIIGVELWKWAKRVYFRHHNAYAQESHDNAIVRHFERYNTMASSSSNLA